MSEILGKDLSHIEQILLKEGFIDWFGGKMRQGEVEHINYDECIILMKKMKDGEWYMRVYATDKIHQKAYHPNEKYIRIEKPKKKIRGDFYE